MKQVTITDLEFIRSLLASRSVTTWGAGPIPDTGLYLLATTSPVHKGDEQHQYVCSLEGLAKARE